MSDRTVVRRRTFNQRHVSLTVALSTVGKRIASFEQQVIDLKSQTRSDFELLILLQNSNDLVASRLEEVLLKHAVHFQVSVVVSDTVGLLLSRNLALANASAPLVLLADDDCRYYESSCERVIEEADRNPESEIMTFQAHSDQGCLLNPRNAISVTRQHSVRSIMSVCSVEIAVRASLRDRFPRLFDERFGLGTPFNTGGENIMLLDNLKRGVRITQHPVVVVSHPAVSSGTGKNGLEQLAFAKGAMLKRMFGWKGGVLLLVFMLLKRISKEGPHFQLRHVRSGLEGCRKSPRVEK
ncbi:glycosyl transferase family 2 [Tamilnaduibacter salinus]|uniref:Glycosyl transferase family 2 n=1 Tax=Tamilnaduibacter salinus TaxID=1484056 RepID=A0A2A2HZ88_9GAMM|nr:glycosyltransferase family A protein [Tamilnaduibacter salinus]PAV24991.1 hypothetical protein CF392_13300 [Tamilnaduibacter salinus]PVY70834.1 glycosyl transferase family 2 [Tamilnaduibacter salinus]